MVDVFIERPRTTAATSTSVSWCIEIVTENSCVRGVGLINNLQYDIEVCVLGQRVHSSVCNGHVNVSTTFSNDTKEAINRVDLNACYSDVLAVHLDNREVVVLGIPTKIVDPVSKVVGGVSNSDVRSGC